MLRVGVFAAVTAALAVISTPSFRFRSSYGIYRFFAWEAIAALVMLNFRGLGPWFADPLSAHQLASWTLLSASLAVLVAGVAALRTLGHPDGGDRDGPLFGIERTTTLVTTGVYSRIRHPLYASLLYLAWGVLLKRPGWVAGLLAAAATGLLYATAKAEEREDIRFFGEPYQVYMTRTRMFVPFLV